jgi:hypothetical protein
LEALIAAWADQPTLAEPATERDPHTDPRYYTFEEFFLHLGMSDEPIAEALARADAEDSEE